MGKSRVFSLVGLVLSVVILIILVLLIVDKLQSEVDPRTVIDPSAPDLTSATKREGCAATRGLPDFACTPGAVFVDKSLATICQSGYTKTVRNVSLDQKKTVYRNYSIDYQTQGEYEVDHLIPLELGGSNDMANLWPEAADPNPGYHEKDAVENYLHDQVCQGKLELHLAQIQIAHDWLYVYNKVKDTPHFDQYFIHY